VLVKLRCNIVYMGCIVLLLTVPHVVVDYVTVYAWRYLCRFHSIVLDHHFYDILLMCSDDFFIWLC